MGRTLPKVPYSKKYRYAEKELCLCQTHAGFFLAMWHSECAHSVDTVLSRTPTEAA